MFDIDVVRCEWLPCRQPRVIATDLITRIGTSSVWQKLPVNEACSRARVHLPIVMREALVANSGTIAT
jgi:hypothetical protein